MKKLLPRSPMFIEAAEKKSGLKLILEILVCLLVFSIASAAQSVILTPAMLVWLEKDAALFSGLFDLGRDIASSDDFSSALDAYMENISGILSRMPDWLMILQLFVTVFMIVVVILFCKLIQKRSLSSLGFGKEHVFRSYAIGALAGIVTLSASLGINLLAGSMKLGAGQFNVFVILLYLLGYVIQGASEEILCRGYFMVSVARKHSMLTALITSSVFFAALHLGNPGMTLLSFLNLFLSGIMFGVYVIKTGNLWGACAMHTFWNFFQGNFFGVQVSGLSQTQSFFAVSGVPGKELLTGGSFGLEGGLGVTIVEIITILIILFAIPNRFEEKTETAEAPVEI